MALVLVGLMLLGCKGNGPKEDSTNVTVPEIAPTTRPVPKPLTASPLPSLDAGNFHRALRTLGFTASPATGATGFVTTTSVRAGATVSTYGATGVEVVKILAEADRADAPTVMAAVVVAAVSGAEGKKAETWVRAELKKGPLSASRPRTAKATYAKQPFELIVNGATATLGIGRLNQ